MQFNNRKFELLFQNRDFSRIAAEITTHEEKFALAGGSDKDFRQAFEGSPFKDSPSIPCRLTYDMEEQPSEAELIEYLKTVGITDTNATDCEIYQELPEVYAVVMWLAGQVRAEQIGRVLVARLTAGGHVGEHPDFGAYHDFYDRFHICIGGKGCYFKSGAETVKMLPGEIWWFYNNDPHEVWNDSDVDRDHIVLDLKLRGEKMLLRTGGEVPPAH